LENIWLQYKFNFIILSHFAKISQILSGNFVNFRPDPATYLQEGRSAILPIFANTIRGQGKREGELNGMQFFPVLQQK
jgi:hypothetical protein